MKIKLSKSNWEAIGKKAGWIKAAQVSQDQEMSRRMDSFFSPSITLKRHMINGHVINGYWYVDLVKDLPLAKQFMAEAGIKGNFSSISDSNLDAFERAAGKHGYSVETIGD